MRDILGKEIDLGDKVAFSESSYAVLQHGVVSGMTDKRIRIQYPRGGTTLKAPTQVAIVEKFNA
jgi:FMN-dependent NADH-azoreductase